MPNTAKLDVTKATTKEEKDDVFAYARSHESSKFAYETCKVIAQSCLLINGGAATAVIALLSKDKVDQAMLTWVPWGVGAYGAGVVFSAIMLFSVMMMADNWNYFWYWSSYGNNPAEAADAEKNGNWWHYGVYIFFVVAIAFFAAGSALVAVGMAKTTPTSSSPFPSVIYLPAPK